MNAVLSAQTLDWRSSVAYKPEVQVAVRPREVYEFNARATFDRGFRDRLRDGSPATLEECGFERLTATPTDDRLAALQMTDAELKILSELAQLVGKHGMRGSVALEAELKELGYGTPVFVFVFVFLFVFVI
jgi:hypothetical protein